MEEEVESRNEGKPNYKPIRKSGGVTSAEEYLGELCGMAFLSLWSYPGVYRDQGKRQGGGHGREICDLLVVFGEHVIIFSDKHCELKNSGNLSVDWQRWFRKAIQKSAEQAWGAERWIRQNPARIFLDRECEQPLPVDLPNPGTARFHLVVVAHGVSSRIRQEFGGSGSLMIDTALKGRAMHVTPFYVGDLDPQSTFVHVLDEDSLLTVIRARDTVSDFVEYVTKREKLLRGRPSVLATGEEQLLAIYLKNLNKDGEHDFVLPATPGEGLTDLVIPEGHWEDFQRSPERIGQLRRDKISYLWDALIETFNLHALKGDQHFVTGGSFKTAEKILRFMAREPRLRRRTLSEILADMLKTTRDNQKRVAVLCPAAAGDPHYVFLLLPMPNRPDVSYERYREVRRHFLEHCCKVTKLKYPDAKDVVGIATEPGVQSGERSEDAVYFDSRVWTPSMESEARELQKTLGILVNPREMHIHSREYPEVVPVGTKLKNYRNKPCPCGSGRKYKHCCLNK